MKGEGSTIIFSCEGLTRLYDGVPVVRDVSVALPEGGFVSLVGPSGVGKTTLFHLLSGVDRPDEGRVLLAGEDVTGLAGRVSYMLQKDLLFEFYTVLDNVILPLTLRGIPKKQARHDASAYFPQFGLSGFENKYPRQLSGGMRQRAALLRTCLTDNKVILLDEPFSALDAITRREMQTWYVDIAQSMKLSTLCITHDVEEAVILSDTVCVMTGRPGQITARIDIPFARPRGKDFQTSQAFATLKREILDAIGV